MVKVSSPPWQASPAVKLFVTGATIGPLVDSLHNQCLLRYEIAPIAVHYYGSTNIDHLLFASSWTVTPLLGIAYVVLGQFLPTVLQSIVQEGPLPQPTDQFRNKALLAVLSTALACRTSWNLSVA